jgi:hypothetical protein
MPEIAESQLEELQSKIHEIRKQRILDIERLSQKFEEEYKKLEALEKELEKVRDSIGKAESGTSFRNLKAVAGILNLQMCACRERISVLNRERTLLRNLEKEEEKVNFFLIEEEKAEASHESKWKR